MRQLRKISFCTPVLQLASSPPPPHQEATKRAMSLPGKSSHASKVSQCPFPGCGKIFKRGDYLTRHISTHNNKRPHVCEKCSVSFTRRDLLVKHLRTKSHLVGGEKHAVFINTESQKYPYNSQDDEPRTPQPERFTNVSSGVEDSFGWLFGDQSSVTGFLAYNDIYSSTPVMSYSKEETPSPQSTFDFAFSSRSFDSIQDFLQDQVGLDPSTSQVLFSSSQLNILLSHYWNDFSPMYPIIHRPTFDVNTMDGKHLNSIFILSLVTIGMICSPSQDNDVKEEYHRVACLIQKHLRTHILQQMDSMDYSLSFIPLKLLQAHLLTNIFHMSYGDSSQYTKFHVYHPVTANVFKELKLFVDLSEPLCDPNNFNYASWCQWIRFESFKRIALVAYALDTQASFILLKSPSISAFEIQLEMPYTDSVWLAETPQLFLEEYSKLPRDFVQRSDDYNEEYENTRYKLSDDDVMTNGNLLPNVRSEGRWPNLLWSLRRLFQPYKVDDQEYHYNCFSQFSRFILLHAALALVRELRSTNLFTDLKSMIPNSSINSAAAKIEQGFFRWRFYFQVNIAKSNEAISIASSPEVDALNVYDTSLVFWANITLHHIGLLGLYCNFSMVTHYTQTVLEGQIEEYSHLIESPGRQRYNAIESVRNKVLVSSWAKSKDGQHSLVQACLLLQTVLSDESIIRKIPHLPKALYISGLVCWCYCYISSKNEKSDTITKNPSTTVAVSKDDAVKFITYVLDQESGQGEYSSPHCSEEMIWLKYLLVYINSLLPCFENTVSESANDAASLLLLSKII